MSNAERQARFRASHPGYNRRYRGSVKAHRRRQLQIAAGARPEALATVQVPAPTPPAEVPPVTWMAA